jgi:25S rRNA (uracil2634-N3)-methyltransferase
MADRVASPAVGHDSAANGGGSREEGAAPAEEGALGMRVHGNRVAAPVDGAPAAAEIAVEGDEAEEEADEEEYEDDEEEEKWLGQYSSTQSILLVGDGDFSFSLALATGFGSGANLVATSLDTYGSSAFALPCLVKVIAGH